MAVPADGRAAGPGGQQRRARAARSPLGGARRPRSLGRLSLRRMLSPAAAAAAPTAPSAGGGDARAPGSNGRAGLRARLREAEGAPASPAWPGARTSAPSALAPASGAARPPTPTPPPALPFTWSPSPLLAPIPPRPRPPPSQPRVCPVLWGAQAVCVCVKPLLSFLFYFIFLDTRQLPESPSPGRLARRVRVVVSLPVSPHRAHAPSRSTVRRARGTK